MINRNTNGITRTVLLTKNYALKFPSCRYGWRIFLNGLLANMQEGIEWGQSGLDGLCLVVYANRFGFLVVMPKLKILDKELTEEEYELFRNRVDYIIPVENKADSFGWWKDKLVAVDYGS